VAAVPIVGVLVNPWAGKDVRRLHAPVGHTPDTAKIGIVRRVVLGALDAGAERVLVARDLGRIAERAVHGIGGAFLLDGPGTGSALDTRRAAAQFADLGCGCVVALGGDGTCRDVAMGWPDVTLVAISTGTNNVFPVFVDGSSAGTAAGLVASGRIPLGEVAVRGKRLVIDIEHADGTTHRDIALVDVAAIDEPGTGARAVVRADRIRSVVAAIASPASTGLSSIAGRTHPLGRDEPGAVVVHLGRRVGGPTRRVRVPIVPGSFSELDLARIERLADGEGVGFAGPLVLAYDGERDRVLPEGAVATVSVDRGGPVMIDVERALWLAATRQLFDVASRDAGNEEATHGD
jgi:hypothetical protein